MFEALDYHRSSDGDRILRLDQWVLDSSLIARLSDFHAPLTVNALPWTFHAKKRLGQRI